jgi:hypothetical protein
MPADAKPLFRPDVLHRHVKAFALPAALDAVRGDLAAWADLVASGRIDQFKETELLPEFVTLFFNRVLSYRGASDGGAAWTLSHQRHVEVESEFADAVLGRFAAGAAPRFTVAVEVKGPKDPLDRPFAGRRLSAVDQAYRYAINLPCDWLIVTSMREIRLYAKAALADPKVYDLDALKPPARGSNCESTIFSGRSPSRAATCRSTSCRARPGSSSRAGCRRYWRSSKPNRNPSASLPGSSRYTG